MERRLHTRHRARTSVRIRKSNGDARLCTATNLSALGVAIQTTNMGLAMNEEVNLTFIINLGVVSKLHIRKARAVHIRNGLTGFSMHNHGAK